MAPNVVIVAWDAATWDLIDPWLAEGRLPTLGRFLACGVRGDLRSTIPALTGPAWVAFKTGMNPGRSGIFDFANRDPATLRYYTYDNRALRLPTLWDLCHRAGLRTGVLFEPTSYPIDDHPGFAVAGFLCPGADNPRFVHPPDLLQRHGVAPDSCVADTKINRYYPDRLPELLDKTIATLRHQNEAAVRLLRDEPCDIFMAHFQAIDIACHAFWRFFEGGAPADRGTDGTLHDAIRLVYEEADRGLGRLLDCVDLAQTAVVLLSDHGSGAKHANVHVNRWLHERGLLAVRDVPLPALRQRLAERWRRGQGIGVTRRAVLVSLSAINATQSVLPGRLRVGLTRFINRSLDARPEIKARLQGGNLFFDHIDWQRTKAYAIGATGGICINLKGREAHGTVDPSDYEGLMEQIIRDLREIRDDAGRQVVPNPCRRDEVYDGPEVVNAPDIIIATEENGFLQSTSLAARRVIEDSQPYRSGSHREFGIVAAAGPMVGSNGRLADPVAMVDLFPTVAHLLGLAIPEGLDGSCVQAIFDPAWLAEHPPVYGEPMVAVAGRSSSAEAAVDGDEEILRRLEGLGYL